MIGFSSVGSQAFFTASHICTTNSGDVSLKHSGLNSYCHWVMPSWLGSSFVIDRAYFVHFTASAILSSGDSPKTMRLKHSDVAR